MEYSGYYGSNQTPCTILTYSECGGTWYCVEGSTGVNFTNDMIDDKTDVETLTDIDYFTWNEPINTIEELETAVKA